MSQIQNGSKDYETDQAASSCSLLVLYGSETGTAQNVALELWRNARCRQLKCRVKAIDEYHIERLRHEKLVVFVVATCGQGDAPANMRANWRRMLARDLTIDYLSAVKVAIIGLGDSSYEKYNFAAKRLFRRCIQLGAQCLMDLALADDRHPLGIEGTLAEWYTTFWLAVQEARIFVNFDASMTVPKCYHIYRHKIFAQSELSELKIFNGLHTELTDDEFVDAKRCSNYDKSNPFSAKIFVNRELHNQPASERSCRHVEFLLENQTLNEITNSITHWPVESLEYAPGDHLGVFPANDARLVEKMAYLLNLNDNDLETVFEMVDKEDENHRPFPCPCTYRTALIHYTDISTPVRANLLSVLAEYTSDEMQREKLQLFASTTTEEGVNEYFTFVHRARRNIVDILEQFNACRPPIELLFEVLPRLQPRFYSISSSLNRERCVHLGGSGRNVVALTSLVLNYKIGPRSLSGVCTNFLAQKKVGEHCEVFIRRGSLNMSDEPGAPIIMIGPGTGFAPFRGFIYERLWLRDECNMEIGPTILYFGCRHPDQDYIYRDELVEFNRIGILTQLHVAFSRTQDEKVYVQHKLRANGAETWQMIYEKGAFVYVCGDAKNMAKDVRETFLEIFSENGGFDKGRAENYLRELEKQKRYQTDVWS